MIPRIGKVPEKGQRYKVRAGAYGVLVRGGEMLLTYQNAPSAEFQLPGGGIDEGESPLQALHREVLEETGFRITGARRIGAFRRFTFMPDYNLWAEKLCHVYAARPCLQVCEAIEQGHESHWMDVTLGLGLLSNEGDRRLGLEALRRGLI